MTMAYAGLARVFGTDVTPLILDFLSAAEAFDEGLVATSRSFAVDVQRALRSRACRHYLHYVQLELAERFMAEAAGSAELEVRAYALDAAGIPTSAAMDAEVRASMRLRTSQERLASFALLGGFTRDLCLRLVLAAHETGYVALALKARVCISRMRGNYDYYSDDSRLSAFLAPGGPLAAARNQAGAAREYCREVWPEADTPPGDDWPPARTDWRRVDDGLAHGGRTSAEMQRADRGGPVRNSVLIPAQVIDSGSRERPRRTPRRSGVLCCR